VGIDQQGKTLRSQSLRRSSDAEQARWELSAPSWVTEADNIARMTRGATDALLSAVAPRPREHILDLASGPGDPALSLARAVGPHGRVLASDAVAPMLEALTRRAADAQLDWLETLDCAAQELDLPPQSFDAACCRFGAMFFIRLDDILLRVARTLMPGGRIVFVVWAAAPANPYFTISSAVLEELGAPPPTNTEQLATVFEWAEAGALAGRLTAAGFVRVTETPHDFMMELPDTPAREFLARQLTLSRPLAERHALLSAEAQATARSRVTEQVAPFERDEGLSIPARCLVVRGETPH